MKTKISLTDVFSYLTVGFSTQISRTKNEQEHPRVPLLYLLLAMSATLVLPS